MPLPGFAPCACSPEQQTSSAALWHRHLPWPSSTPPGRSFTSTLASPARWPDEADTSSVPDGIQTAVNASIPAIRS
jgi:hypothetical protein